MIIENIKSKKRFDISKDTWDNDFVAKGNDYKYSIVDDDSPMEVKSLRKNLSENKLPIKKTTKKSL